MSTTSHKINREKMHLTIGKFFTYNKDIYKITQLIDFQEVIGINVETNEAKRLLIENLKPVKEEF